MSYSQLESLTDNVFTPALSGSLALDSVTLVSQFYSGHHPYLTIQYPVLDHIGFSVTPFGNPSISKSGVSESNRRHLTWKDSVLPLN